MSQLSLFAVQKVYAEAGSQKIKNDELYGRLAAELGFDKKAFDEKTEIGKGGEFHSPLKRKVRWYQQTLKNLGVIKKVDGERGAWEFASDAEKGLNAIMPNVSLVAYSTKLGVGIWGDCKAVFGAINEPIHLCLTSPPYPLKVQRNYGNVSERDWVNFIIESLEPIVARMSRGGSLVLNVSNDIFISKTPARSTYLERMVMALTDELGLSLMDRMPWVNYSKPPAPTHWACIKSTQLCSAWEPVFWFTNDPDRVKSNNRAVLKPHTEQHKAFVAKGNTRVTNYADGAYRLRLNSFANETEGSLPKNVIERGSRCADTLRAHRVASENNLPRHSAMFPSALAEFFIKFLTTENDLVVDPFSGSNKVGLVAERLGRRWLATERILQYIQLQAAIFKDESAQGLEVKI